MRGAVVAAVAATGAVVLGGSVEAGADPVPASGNVWGLPWDGSSYPTRPLATTVPAGLAQYVGPNQPTDWLPGDVWVATLGSPSTASPSPGPRLVQAENGNGPGGTNTFHFPSATTAGSTLVVMLDADAGSEYALPSGWVLAASMPPGAGDSQAIYFYPNAPGGIDSVTVTCSTLDFTAWLIAEFAMPSGPASIDWTAQYANYPYWTASESYSFATGHTPAAPGGLLVAQVNGLGVTAPGWSVFGNAVTFTGLFQAAGTTPVAIDVSAPVPTQFAIDVLSIKV